MRGILLLLAVRAAMGALPAAGEQSIVKRLDGSTITSAKIDETVTRLMHAAEVTGAGVAVINHGKIVCEKTYGFRDTKNNLPLTEDSVMYAASFSKVAFAYMVMQFVEEGVLDLDKRSPVSTETPAGIPCVQGLGR